MTLEEIADRFGVDIHPSLSGDDSDRFLTVVHAALAEVCEMGRLNLPEQRTRIRSRPTTEQALRAYEIGLAAIGRPPLTENERTMGALLYDSPGAFNRSMLICRLYDSHEIDADTAQRLAVLAEAVR